MATPESPAIQNLCRRRCARCARWNTSSVPESSSAYELLGLREREVLKLLAEGQSSKEIAGRLGLAVKTVETHRRNIADKTGLHSIAELTKYAVREGLTSLE